jgi:hypothetical protein
MLATSPRGGSDVGGLCGGLLAQKGLGRLLHRGGMAMHEREQRDGGRSGRAANFRQVKGGVTMQSIKV